MKNSVLYRMKSRKQQSHQRPATCICWMISLLWPWHLNLVQHIYKQLSFYLCLRFIYRINNNWVKLHTITKSFFSSRTFWPLDLKLVSFSDHCSCPESENTQAIMSQNPIVIISLWSAPVHLQNKDEVNVTKSYNHVKISSNIDLWPKNLYMSTSDHYSFTHCR